MRITKYRAELNEVGHPSLVKETAMNYREFQSLNEASKIARMLNDCFRLDKLAEEHMFLVGMNMGCKPLGVFELSHGTASQAIVSPRELFIRLLLIGATQFVIAHNHPGGTLCPSKDDLDTTKRIKESAMLLGVPLLDHIIVSQTGHYSFHQHEQL